MTLKWPPLVPPNLPPPTPPHGFVLFGLESHWVKAGLILLLAMCLFLLKLSFTFFYLSLCFSIHHLITLLCLFYYCLISLLSSPPLFSSPLPLFSLLFALFSLDLSCSSSCLLFSVQFSSPVSVYLSFLFACPSHPPLRVEESASKPSDIPSDKSVVKERLEKIDPSKGNF